MINLHMIYNPHSIQFHLRKMPEAFRKELKSIKNRHWYNDWIDLGGEFIIADCQN